MNQEITCPKCSYEFALDEALNRDIELQVRKQLSEEFKNKEAELRRQLAKEASEKAERNSAELQIKLEAQAKELKASRENERALLRKKAELQAQAERGSHAGTQINQGPAGPRHHPGRRRGRRWRCGRDGGEHRAR